jgi:hypothetical protein
MNSEITEIRDYGLFHMLRILDGSEGGENLSVNKI